LLPLRLRLPRFLRLLLLLRCARLLRSAIASAAAAATAAALLVVGCRLSVVRRRALLLLPLLLRRTWLLLLALMSALGVRLLPARRIRSSAALFGAAIALSGAGRLALAAIVAFLLRRAGLLLPLPHFLLHETALLRLGARTRLVVSAVRATLPTFWIRLLAMRAEDALRERHSKSARIVHFAPWPTTRAARRSRR